MRSLWGEISCTIFYDDTQSSQKQISFVIVQSIFCFTKIKKLTNICAFDQNIQQMCYVKSMAGSRISLNVLIYLQLD